MAEREDDFLRRWSRRKAESRDNLQQKKAKTGPDQRDADLAEGEDPFDSRFDLLTEPEGDAGDGTEIAGRTEGEEGEDEQDEPEKVLTEEDFADVDFDALDYESDYRRFMVKGVPELIQRKALRKLWQSNPILACVDGLNDYDEDFTDAALAVDAIKTAYKVGRGYLSDEDLEEMEKIGKPDSDETEQEGGEVTGEKTVAEAEPGETPDGSGDPDGSADKDAAAGDEEIASNSAEADGQQEPAKEDDPGAKNT